LKERLKIIFEREVDIVSDRSFRYPVFKEPVEKQRPSFMKDEIRKNFIDILQAAEEMQRFTQGMNFREYQNGAITQRTDERDLRLSGKSLAG
jgi:hypothetical protein